jgi:hypothetical protein
MSNKALDYMNPTCPEGAKWYACAATTTVTSPFVGCCKTDPCGVSGCNQGNIEPVSFNASAYDLMGAELREPSCSPGSAFYTCIDMPKNETTFWGCCKSNVCGTQDKSCKTGDLTMATIGDKDQQASYGIKGSTSGDDKDGGSSHTTAIIGGAVGGGVAVVAIIAVLLFCLFKKRRSKSRRGSGSSAVNNGFPGPEKTHRNSAISEGTNTHATPGTNATISPSGHHDGRRQAAQAPGFGNMSNGSPAPPLYDSPKPPPFASFGGQHQYQQIAQTSEPVEMPAEYTAGPVQRYSELPAEATQMHVQQPVEMESPMMSPYISPKPSPRIPQSPLAHGERPRTADTAHGASLGPSH